MDIENENAAEVMRLKGELSCATHVIALLYNLIGKINPSGFAVLRRHMMEVSYAPEPHGITGDQHWREGVDRFQERLLKVLPSNEV